MVVDVLLWLVWLGLGWLLGKIKGTKTALSFALDAGAPRRGAWVSVVVGVLL